MMPNEKVVVLFSAGHDSFYCLFDAISRFGKANVHCLIYSYNQTNKLEIENAESSCKELDIQFSLIELPRMDKNLNKKGNVSSHYYPGRNLIFLSVACSFAEQHGYGHLSAGFCSEDNADFPDCRQEFLDMFSEIQSSSYHEIRILTPCLSLTKRETYERIMSDLEFSKTYTKFTYSCYNNSSLPFLDRKGCGECAACLSIKKGIFNASC